MTDTLASSLSAYVALSARSEELKISVGGAEELPHYATGSPSLNFVVSVSYDPTDSEPSPHANLCRTSPSAGGSISRTYFTAFYESLLAWSEKHNVPPEVDIFVTLPSDFPRSPPEVRVLRPVFEAGTGGVINGFLMGVPELFPRGWAPGTTLAKVIGWVKGSLPGRGALVDVKSQSFYSLQAYAATRRRVVGAAVTAPAHRSDFSQNYFVFSSSFAERFMAARVPDGFDAGGKALFPTAALERVMRTELRDGLNAGAAVSGGRGVGGGSALLGAAVTAAGLAGRSAGGGVSMEQLLNVNADDAMTSEAAMVFELHSPLGFSTFVGVREFTSPEPDIIIIPPEMLANLGIVEGTQVRVTRADLPQLTSLVLQPHSTAFLDVEETTGCPPRDFLEMSFNNFSAFSPGETLLCSGGAENCGLSDVDILFDSEDPENAHKSAIALRVRPPQGAYRFTIVSIEPAEAPAAQLFRGFAASINIEFLPAQDTLELPARSPAVGQYQGGGTFDDQSSGGGASAPFGASMLPPAPLVPQPIKSARGIGSRALAYDPATALASALASPSSVGGSSGGARLPPMGGAGGGHQLGGVVGAAAAHAAPFPAGPVVGPLATATPEVISPEERRRRAADAAARRFAAQPSLL